MPTQYLIRRDASQAPPYPAAQMGQALGEQLARFPSGWIAFCGSEPARRVGAWRQTGRDGPVIGDESVWEKSESLQAEDLCAVRSSKARRLTHYEKGF